MQVREFSHLTKQRHREPHVACLARSIGGAGATAARTLSRWQRGLPAVYSYRFFVTSGGLIAYGIDGKELWWAAASDIDRILRGEKPGDLPVQLPTNTSW